MSAWKAGLSRAFPGFSPTCAAYALHNPAIDGDGVAPAPRSAGLPVSDGRPVGVTVGGADGVADREVAGGLAGVPDHGVGRAPVPAASATPEAPRTATTTAALTVSAFARAD